MPQTFVRKTFDQWLSRNCERFTCKPVLTRASKRGFDLKFENVTDAITCSIRGTGRNEIWVKHGPHSDLLTDFDLLERRDSNGRYYCGFCMNEHRKYYASRQELWENESFEPMLIWANECFTDLHRLRLRVGDGWVHVRIYKRLADGLETSVSSGLMLMTSMATNSKPNVTQLELIDIPVLLTSESADIAAKRPKL